MLLSGVGDHRLEWLSSGPTPSGLVGPLPEGTKEADKKVKGVPGIPNCPPLLWRR